jgi:hypothetical protein
MRLTREEDSGDHAGDDPEEEGEDFESGGEDGASLGVRHVLGRQAPLHHDLKSHKEKTQIKKKVSTIFI